MGLLENNFQKARHEELSEKGAACASSAKPMTDKAAEMEIPIQENKTKCGCSTLIANLGVKLANIRCANAIGLAVDYLHQHYHRPIQRAEVAAFVKMNPSYFSTIFADVIGMTFQKYLERLRLTKAQELLRDPTRGINEVANAVGYMCPNRFRDVFKANTGLSPSAWREQQGF